jgi:hypothetical protein
VCRGRPARGLIVAEARMASEHEGETPSLLSIAVHAIALAAYSFVAVQPKLWSAFM